jgi:hypothetical protein
MANALPLSYGLLRNHRLGEKEKQERLRKTPDAAGIRGGGGAALIISPNGKLFRMPVSILAHSPFRNFLVPGVILFCVFGLVSSGLVFALVKKPECRLAEQTNFFNDMHWSWTYSIYVAFARIIWIQAEIVFLQAVHWLHTLYLALALAINFVELLPQVRLLYRK